MKRALVIGAGAGGLAAAIDLARRGFEVIVLERAPAPGGKIRQVEVLGQGLDCGPTVFTMRWVFEELFAAAGARLEDYLHLIPAELLARHAWRAGGVLDLYADLERSAEAIAAFAGPADARAYRAFCAESAAVFAFMKQRFITAQRPSHLEVARRVGLAHLGEFFARARPLTSLWAELGRRFRDPRLRQLFARYATYVGSSPLATPAAIMLVAHVEQEGVWLAHGGMQALAAALAKLGAKLGVEYRYGAGVGEILVEQGRAAGVALESGERLAAEVILFNGDVSAFGAGLLGQAAQGAAKPIRRRERSLGAVTWALGARTRGLELAYHTVFFAEDYPREFQDAFGRRRITEWPTVYACAPDRAGVSPPQGPERLFLLANAPADGDQAAMSAGERASLQGRVFGLLEACGLSLELAGEPIIATPSEFHARFPASGGALYGRHSHGPNGTLARLGARSRLPGLYLCGGGVHPGPGVPMAAMSGRLAAAAAAEDAG